MRSGESRTYACLMYIISTRFDQRGKDNSQLLSEIFECFRRKRFRKYINNLFFGGNILQFNLLFKHLFTSEVILDRNVLGLGMHNKIL